MRVELSKREAARLIVLVIWHFKNLILEQRLSKLEINLAFLENAEPHIEEYRKLLVKRFDEMEKEVLAKIKKPGKSIYHESKEYWIDKAGFDVDKWLFSKKKWYGTFGRDNGQMIGAVLPEVGQQALDDLEVGAAFDQVDERALEFMATNAKNAGWSITNTQYKALKKELMEGLAEGESIPKLRARIMNAMAVAKGRAELIARTEVLKGSNRGAMIGMMQSGVVEGKEWLAAMDKRTCTSCEEMDGATMPLDKAYYEQGATAVIGGVEQHFDYEEIQHPPLHPDCRCTLLAVLKEAHVTARKKPKGTRGHIDFGGRYPGYSKEKAGKFIREDFKKHYGKYPTKGELANLVDGAHGFSLEWDSRMKLVQLGFKAKEIKAYTEALRRANGLEKLFNFCPSFDPKKTIYRGLKADPDGYVKNLMDALKAGKLKEGSTLKVDCSTHWTTDSGTAKKFDGEVIFRTKGVDKSTSLRHLSEFFFEDEVAVSKDAVFKIKKAVYSEPTNKWSVWLEPGK